MTEARWWSSLAARWRPAGATAARLAPPPPPTPQGGVAPTSAAADSIARSSPALDSDAPALLRPLYLLCLLGSTPQPGSAASAAATASAPDPAALQMLERLDRVIASDILSQQLLLRAPAVVPQLMRSLRDEAYSSVDVARRISRDTVLTAEVIRLASNTLRSADMAAVNLAQAVAVIGTQGLRQVIARVVLRPLFAAHGDTLSARAAPHIWADANKKARLCAMLAAGGAFDPLDAYLAGLLHNAGWSAALRAIDGQSAAALPAASWAHPDIVDALFLRRDRLFAKLVPAWQVGLALDALADEIGQAGLDAAASPLARLLRQAQELAMLHSLQAHGVLSGGVVPPEALPLAVRKAYRELSDG